ncbi:12970_t:CDS:2 [Dentiscutata erythropus]|uniref:12970_t:CDS:1 n=1 Tax=Dentiscutata erythropus TaxID=1348616 RepID=A0A9N8Z014_9GLOM|nr:12970_t:CDS:2 [Dentiscutata erythropus]
MKTLLYSWSSAEIWQQELRRSIALKSFEIYYSKLHPLVTFRFREPKVRLLKVGKDLVLKKDSLCIKRNEKGYS